MGVNWKRIWLGTLAGGVVWSVWSFVVNAVGIGEEGYAAAQEQGWLLTEPRYPFFIGVWLLTLFLLAYVVAWLYAGVRATYGPGPKTAVAVGVLVGFAAGFPLNFAQAAWSQVDRVLPLWWMLELWIGAILAALLAGWLYKEA